MERNIFQETHGVIILQEGNPWGDHSIGGISWGDNSTGGSAGVKILQVILFIYSGCSQTY